MTFQTTPTGYEKTILSDLQGAWSVFREAVADTGGFKGTGDVLFHTDEAMSWEVVRNLKLMPPLILIIRNLCTQGNAPEEGIRRRSLWHNCQSQRRAANQLCPHIGFGNSRR
jgi:hypothetical protein